MARQRRNRAKVLTVEALGRLNTEIRQHEFDHNGATKYSLETLGELTGLDPETVGKVLDRQGNDKRILERCCAAFGITLTNDDYIPVSQVTPPDIDPSFVGREEAIAHLQELVKRNAKIIVIQARGGVGKTTLARRFLDQEFDQVIEFPIAKETKDIASIESLLEEKLRQLGEEPGREFLVSCDRLKRKLQHDRIGILIDNLEPALDSAGRLIEPHRRYVEVLRILADPSVQSTTLITSRERLRESSVTVETYLLKSLDLETWQMFFASRSLATDIPALEALHNAYGGNAKAMEIISGAIAQDFEGDVGAYWQENQDDLFIERDLEDLVKEQFERLQEHNLDAYNLLCRMGCYRYQDVPTVPVEGLFCLMWDVPEKEHKRVVKVLRDRSLVEFDGLAYALHPSIKLSATHALHSDDWIKANLESAAYWTKLVKSTETLNDALQAFEAYWHYCSIENFDAAAFVIVKRRLNRWKAQESLGATFYRLGFQNQIIKSVKEIIPFIKSEYIASRTHNILGDFYWLDGKFTKAIMAHSKSGKIANKISQNRENLNKFTENDVFEIQRLQGNMYLNISLCLIDLWELRAANKFMHRALPIWSKSPSYKSGLFDNEQYPVIIWSVLSFLKANLNLVTEAEHLAQLTYNHMDLVYMSNWAQGYIPFFLGETYFELKEYSKSYEMYSRMMSYALDSSYVQVEANALVGFSKICRQNSQIDESVDLALKAIKILDKINARCDLAKAYYQTSLSYKVVANHEKSQNYLSKAIRTFHDLKALKQVKRIQEE